MRETLTSLLVNNKGADQPAHPHSLVSTFVIRYLKARYLLILHFGGLQHDKDSGYAPVHTCLSHNVSYFILSFNKIVNLKICIKYLMSKNKLS